MKKYSYQLKTSSEQHNPIHHTFAIIRKYNFHKNSILLLWLNNEWTMKGCDNIFVLIKFWRQSVRNTAFDRISSYDNNIFTESISIVKRIILGCCLSTIHMLKANENVFRCQLLKQIHTYLRQYHLKLLLLYGYELVYNGSEEIFESIFSDWDKIYDSERVQNMPMNWRHTQVVLPKGLWCLESISKNPSKIV